MTEDPTAKAFAQIIATVSPGVLQGLPATGCARNRFTRERQPHTGDQNGRHFQDESQT